MQPDDSGYARYPQSTEYLNDFCLNVSLCVCFNIVVSIVAQFSHLTPQELTWIQNKKIYSLCVHIEHCVDVNPFPFNFIGISLFYPLITCYFIIRN